MGDPKKANSALMEGGHSGFAALPGGTRRPNREFLFLGQSGYYWTAEERNQEMVWRYAFNYQDSNKLHRGYTSPKRAYSCRCLKS